MRGTPMVLYFIKDQDEESCGLYLNDGNCDLSFHTIGYHYDEGDCCAAKYTDPSCGFGGITSVFGNTNSPGDGYPFCIDPTMLPITIRLDNIQKNHNDVLAIDWIKHYANVGISVDPFFIEKTINEYFQKEPQNSLLTFDCNDKNVMTIVVDKSMENETETVMVEDGANCTINIQNTTGDSETLLNNIFPILHINYTTFHGDKASIEKNPIIIASEPTSTQDTINFSLVPNCYLDKLMDYFDITTLYTGSTPANKAINWLMDDKSENSDCENPYFVERYALSVISFTAPLTYEELLPPALSPTISPTLLVPLSTVQPTDQPLFTIETLLPSMNNISSSAPSSAPNSTEVTMPWISSQNQCSWTQISCKEGRVMSLTFESTTIVRSIATEICLLSNLEKIFIGKF